MNENGLVTLASSFPVADTTDRLVNAATAAGLRIFARVDHAAGAVEVGMPLRPTELLIFGHPKGGTPLMMDKQTAGIDLPVKALVWQDEAGAVWLTYNDATWIAERHGLGEASEPAVAAMNLGLARLAQSACVG
jgi:uncharacterized protein (DUF302 family)